MAGMICSTVGCGTEIPPGEMICPNCFEIYTPRQPNIFPAAGMNEPAPTQDKSNTSTEDSRSNLGSSTEVFEIVCPVCGAASAGPSCQICGHAFPAHDSPRGQSTGMPPNTPSNVTLTLPGAVALTLAEGETVVLGRESNNEAVAASLSAIDTVSRQHARISVHGKTIEVVDLGSANGTFVEGRPLGSTPVTREVPTRIGLGRSVIVEVQ
ncbi:FHA domain-containing protein [Glutamicibacter protophormiae]|uniref:FHA domain-containing protein n=1 Tax=Glutamicibacter protophormiae TaxID=37930 RepID=UPI002A7EA5CD|nr:FHA domain-containing protein [Glutamicibacter protophormiae]WPR63625.1 FHA domain-containing protein [Glutamicibacter protophormiae]WPR67120.1 FHA domain-containing protein [Glutamicibacter protophormiae]